MHQRFVVESRPRNTGLHVICTGTKVKAHLVLDTLRHFPLHAERQNAPQERTECARIIFGDFLEIALAVLGAQSANDHVAQRSVDFVERALRASASCHGACPLDCARRRVVAVKPGSRPPGRRPRSGQCGARNSVISSLSRASVWRPLLAPSPPPWPPLPWPWRRPWRAWISP